MQEAIHFPLIEYNITEKPQDQFDDRVDAMDLNFAPKLRVKHNARKEWINEGDLLLLLIPQKSQKYPGFFSKMTISVN